MPSCILYAVRSSGAADKTERVPLQVDNGEPKVMWLAGLHIPESYLTALVQAACRKNGWPLDLSTLYTQVSQYRREDEVTDRPGNGSDAHGTIEGDT